MTSVLPMNRHVIGARARRISQETRTMLRHVLVTGLMLCGLTAVAAASEIPPVRGQITITYDKAEKPAEAPPTAENCPPGERYHKDYKRCLPTALVPVAENCPAGERYHKDYKRCLPKDLVPTAEKNCPAGETYHKDYGRCLPPPKVAAPTPPATEKCPEGKVRFGADCVPKAGTPPTTATPKTCERGEVMRNGKCVEIEDERPPTETASFPREVQAELSRIGCLSGSVDGVWGSGSRESLRRFYERAGRSTSNLEPTRAALTATRSKEVGFCRDTRPPTVTRDRDDDDARRCNPGYERNRRGDCVRIVRPEEDETSCPSGLIRRGRACVCRDGFELRGSTCIQIRRQMPPDHGDGEEQRKNQRCPAGSVRRDGRCQRVNCPANAHNTSGINCECNRGYVQRGSQCVPLQRDRETPPDRPRDSTPQQSKTITCRAQAANGAWGQASAAVSDRAAGAAIGECSKRSGGQPCRVVFCR